MTRRRRRVPEVVQTSAMDCGPACLAALLGGFGIRASYGRLREACATDVDGTSIDTIEEIARELGLDAVQVLIPVDHVLLPEADALPAIATLRQPGGDNHFVTAWARRGAKVQVMDPAVGRRWLSARELASDLYVHEMELPADTWRDWAGSEDMTRPLARRLRTIGVSDPAAEIARALADPGWRSIAALDAATRLVQDVIDGGGLPVGRDAAALLHRLAVGDPDHIADAYWSARAGSDESVVRARGAVLVHVSGVRTDRAPPKSADLAAALSQPPPRPWQAVRDAVAADGSWRLAALVLGLVLAGVGTVAELGLFRAIFDLNRELAIWPQLAGAMVALLVALIALALIEIPVQYLVARLGRHVELRLRIRVLSKLPRLAVGYLRSRPRSDLAERAHLVHNVRELPDLAARIARIVLEAIVTTAALIWLSPASAPYAIALLASVILPPLWFRRALEEQDLRVRTHAGALSRFHLDALLGVVPTRTHGVERALRREHEARLVEWTRAARAELRVASAAVTIQVIASFACAIAVVIVCAERTERPASVLLLTYWALQVAWLGFDLAALLRELPRHRNLTLRMLEPLGAPDEEVPVDAPHASGPVALELRRVTAVAGGHRILDAVSVAIAPGEHVAIVGRSGSGKSSLFGVVQGWVRLADGALHLDGRPADPRAIAALRRRTAWVDPGIQLWNASLADNLSYGARDADVADAIAAAHLEDILARLPEGLGTSLGEGGALLSGGEGQRVRFGRAATTTAPALVLLDEPFRGLDRRERGRLLDAARARWAASTLLCATHDVAETRSFPRVLVIDQGRVVEDGAPDELAHDPGSRYRALLDGERAADAAWSAWRRITLADGRARGAS